MQVSKTNSTPVLSDLDLEVVSSGKFIASGIASATARPYIELVGAQAGYTAGESIGRSLGS
jgi:hypothetical protein